MGKEKIPKQEPTPEEISEIRKERTLSDAELIKNGAKYEKEGRLELTKEQIKKVREEMDKEINKKKREQSFEYVKSVAEDMKKIEASGKRPDMKVVLSDGSIVEGVFIKLTGNILTILKHGVPDEPLKPEHHKELGSDYSYYYYQVLKPEWDEERKKFIVDILAEDVKDVYFTGMSLMY